MKIKKIKILYEGKAKIIYSTNSVNLIQYFKDDATAFNAKKTEIIRSKGILNNFISEHLMKKLMKKNIKTHFLKRISSREQLIKKLNIIPIEVVVRNKAAGSIVKKYDIREGSNFSNPIIEFFYKNDSLNDPLLNEDHINAFNLAKSHEIINLKKISKKINIILKDVFNKIDIDLIDFKLEFGTLNGFENKQIILADEISPDNCRLWDKDTGKKLDKDVFRNDLGNLVDAYSEIAKRLNINID